MSRYPAVSATIALVAIFAVASPAAAAVPSVSVPMDAFSMFVTAVPMVKAVMILLVLASVVSWALFVVKNREIAAGIRAANTAVSTLRAVDRLAEAKDIDAGTANMIAVTQLEISKSAALMRQGRIDGVRDRIEEQLVRIEHGMVARMRQGLPVLASVGSVAPFVGLFGTVWGIMHSFMGIAGAKSTSLAVVAPGIAEALLATALGLVAAIPATIMYNLLGRRMAMYRQALGDSATMLGCLASREVEMMTLGSPATVHDLQKRSS